MKKRITLSLVSYYLVISTVLGGGPGLTSVSPKNTKFYKRQNEVPTLKINSYPSDTSTSELCLKTSGEFTQLATCPTAIASPDFHFTIGSANIGKLFIKSSVNGKCKELLFCLN